MKQALPKEFRELIAQYESADGFADSQIRDKLRKIADCYAECSSEERVFADAITVLFCRTIELVKSQRDDRLACIPRDPEEIEQNAYLPAGIAERDEPPPFENGTALRIAFYNHFRNETKKNGQATEYPEIRSLDELKQDRVNATMRDYVARIQTFANGYLPQLPRIAPLLHQDRHLDPVLFTYRHLEWILASFETKEYDPNGQKVSSKQKNNLRSALRKLNEFKRAIEARR